MNTDLEHQFINNGTFFLKVFFVGLFFLNFKVLAQQKICLGSTVRYSVDSSENSGKGSLGSSYHWHVQETSFKGNITNYLSDRTNDVSINWGDTPSGNYTLIANETDANGCIGLNQILIVEILELPPFNLSNQFICINPSTKELVSPAVLDTKLAASDFNFNWQFGGNAKGISPSIEAFEVGNYTVEIQDLNTNCRATYEVDVTLSSSSASKIKVDNFFEDNQSIGITVINGIGDYEYSIDGINFQDSPSFNVTKGGIYTVVIRDKNGCKNETLQAHIVTYPKFFTPNNDGFFDLWKIDGLTPEMEPTVSIFNRYNKLLKIIRYGDVGWDGTFNGFELPSDDYWFTIQYINSESELAIFRSNFSLVR